MNIPLTQNEDMRQLNGIKEAWLLIIADLQRAVNILPRSVGWSELLLKLTFSHIKGKTTWFQYVFQQLLSRGELRGHHGQPILCWPAFSSLSLTLGPRWLMQCLDSQLVFCHQSLEKSLRIGRVFQAWWLTNGLLCIWKQEASSFSISQLYSYLTTFLLQDAVWNFVWGSTLNADVLWRRKLEL